MNIDKKHYLKIAYRVRLEKILKVLNKNKPKPFHITATKIINTAIENHLVFLEEYGDSLASIPLKSNPELQMVKITQKMKKVTVSKESLEPISSSIGESSYIDEPIDCKKARF
jgi:hypothetical protein